VSSSGFIIQELIGHLHRCMTEVINSRENTDPVIACSSSILKLAHNIFVIAIVIAKLPIPRDVLFFFRRTSSRFEGRYPVDP